MASTLLWVSEASAAARSSATPEQFYKGRTVAMIIGYAPGGGYDLYARALAQHMGKHIPGRPNVIPQNMPGAGSLKAANYLYGVAPKDGATIGTFSRAMGSAGLVGHAKFDARKFTWLGSVTKDVSLCISWGASPIKSWADVMSKQFTTGGDGADADPDIFAKLYKNVFGAKIRLATGFPGTAAITLAMQRGEVHGLCGISYSTLRAQHADWLRDKKVNLLIQAAAQKHPELANVPLAIEFARTPEERQILEFVMVSQVMARPFVAPPDIPTDRRDALLAAFNATVKDTAFLADMKRMLLDVNLVPAKDVEAMIAVLYATPKDIVAKTARAITN